MKISGVLEGSRAGRSGIRPGDRLISINGYEIADDLDLRFRAAEGLLELLLHRSGEGVVRTSVLFEEGSPLGLELEDFRAKACNNKCVFCFVDQLPKGVRPTLKFKDDDFRLSFLHGNYLTLTNVSPAEIERIIEQRLSPLFVSVHATDRGVRAKMLGKPVEHCSLAPMLNLIRGGITIHAQVVLCPGINDEASLEQTITDLAAHYPGLVSVAIVPLGKSRYRGNLPELAEVTPSYCQQVIGQVHSLQSGLRTRLGVTFAYLADEFYLQAGQRLPPSTYYDGFDLLEDGIGMIRHFDLHFRRCLRRNWPMSGASPDGTLVTGKLFRPFLERYSRRMMRRFGGQLRVLEVENRFMGPKITVAGLLAGRDIADALRGLELGKFVLIPGECLARDAEVFLDNMSLEQLTAELGVEVREAGRSVEGFFAAVVGSQAKPDAVRRSKQYPRSSMCAPLRARR